MTRRLLTCTLVLAGATALACAPAAHAQQEYAQYYDQARGWQISAYLGGPTGFQGCRAMSGEQFDPILIGYVGGYNTGEAERWQLQVWTSQLDVFGGGIVSVDGRTFDAQFGFADGVASRDLSGAEVQALRNGNQVTVSINGDAPRTWSLSGSAAAMAKAQECHNGGGITPQQQTQTAQILQQRGLNSGSGGAAFVPPGSQVGGQSGAGQTGGQRQFVPPGQQVATPSVPAQGGQRQFVPPASQAAAPSRPVQGGQASVAPGRKGTGGGTQQFVPPAGSAGTVGQSQFNPPQNALASSAPTQSSSAVVATCDAIFSGSYSCNVYDLGPQGRYQEGYEIHDVNGFEPSYLFRVIDDLRADAWVRFDHQSGGWNYVGEWQRFGPDGQCAEPSANLTDEARTNLGQDAWELCVR